MTAQQIKTASINDAVKAFGTAKVETLTGFNHKTSGVSNAVKSLEREREST